jgi:hypothetical protein
MFVELSIFIIGKFLFLLLDFASNDVHKNLHAHFSCPKKLRPKHKRIEASTAKRSLMVINDRQAKARVSGRMVTNRL